MQQTPSQMNMAPSIPTANITTEQIQKLLEENKKLIVAILENQNLGKLAECAQFQAQLQKNLMYLAAIADAQPPQPATPTSQTLPHSAAQQGNFMQNPEAATTQQQQGMFAAKSPFQLNDQQQQQQLQQQQQQQYQQQQQHQQQQPQQHQQPQHHPQQQQQHHQQPQHHQHQQQQQQQQPQQLHFLQQHQQLPFLQQQQQQHQLPFLQQQQLFQSPLGMRHGATSAMHQAMQSGYGGLSSLMAAQGNRQDGSETPSGDGQGKSASGRGD